MKYKRSQRLIDMTQYLINHPYKLTPLTDFVERYQSAKSSISEDLGIIKSQFLQSDLGLIETVAGVSGGVRFIPKMSKQVAYNHIQNLCDYLKNPERMLPGGYFYLTDIIGNPTYLRLIGQVIATRFADQEVDAIMTVATKGVPLAQMAALYLNVPFVMVRRDSKVTEGSTVSINYATKGNPRVEKMELTKSSLAEHSKVLLIDDFMNGGGTISGMLAMLKEFNSECVGVSVLCEVHQENHEMDFPIDSLMRLEKSADNTEIVELAPGSILAHMSDD
ncbi:pur operon repressor [Aerococcus suis]|uniref:Purine operon repressor, PurR n=1 Tax=Aerococcus suis TaxID=371602 RepID=A0A1W1Y3U5_9LACT|nr:pur operon repressor [Aerococcus suis]MCI7239903.1 pur operon repressor [Aerococcus suis]MDD7758097.1 pur operon repressor [Aerococcus suis]MDY4646652.1 pur operon repressor [Aerococcus suis]SMC30819.1 purine operon repressor, PurR [Aerococcus suis]